jgi:hypothetical protein
MQKAAFLYLNVFIKFKKLSFNFLNSVLTSSKILTLSKKKNSLKSLKPLKSLNAPF